MVPKILHWKKKGGETEYCIRAIPIGGFVSLAGEDADDNSKIADDRKLYNKPVWQRFIIMIAGAMNNFIFAFILLFVMALIYGSVSTKPIVANVSDEYPAYEAGIKEGDRIAQLVFLPYLNVEFTKVDELDKTARGDGGFGSTGR